MGAKAYGTAGARRASRTEISAPFGSPCASSPSVELMVRSLAGVIIAAMLAVPLFNLVAPVVAIAFVVDVLCWLGARALR